MRGKKTKTAALDIMMFKNEFLKISKFQEVKRKWREVIGWREVLSTRRSIHEGQSAISFDG